MSQIDYENLINECESNLRSGRIEEHLSLLIGLNHSVIPDRYRLRLAKICRRSGCPDLGLKLIARFVQKGTPADEKHSEELIEYCMCLRNIGALNEAQLRLSKLNVQKSAAGVLCEMYLRFNQFDHEGSYQAAKYYLDHFNESGYQTALVELNLIAALVGLEKFDEARETLNTKLVDFQLKGWPRLIFNGHELMAQVLVQLERYDEAQQHLELAESLGVSAQLKDALYVERWRAVIQSRKTGKVDALKSLAEKAQSINHFETLRVIDFETLNVQFSQRLLDHLYFGTPYPRYKKMLTTKFGAVSESYTLRAAADPTLHLENGTYGSEPLYKPGSKLALLIQGLFSDFYLPIRLGTLFDCVFPGEYFDSEKSFKRVHQLIYRTRRLFEERKLGLDLIENEGGYQLIDDNNAVAVALSKDAAQSRESHYLKQLRGAFDQRAFSAKQCEEVLDLSPSSSYRVIQYGLGQNQLLREGFGSQTRYYFL